MPSTAPTVLPIITPPGCISTRVIVYVAKDAALLSAQDIKKRDLFYSWGYCVNFLTQSSDQATYNSAVAAAGPSAVVFVSEEIVTANVIMTLSETKIGVVTEEWGILDGLYMIGTQGGAWTSTQKINIVNNTHYITQGLTLGQRDLYTTVFNLFTVTAAVAPGIVVLGKTPAGKPSMLAVEKGAALIGGRAAAGKRVFLPWGHKNMVFPTTLSPDAIQFLKRSLEWCLPPAP
jgi:hypothetical protein